MIQCISQYMGHSIICICTLHSTELTENVDGKRAYNLMHFYGRPIKYTQDKSADKLTRFPFQLIKTELVQCTYLTWNMKCINHAYTDSLSNGQFRVISSPDLHLFGLRKETETPRGNPNKHRDWDSKPGPSCCEVAVLPSKAYCDI